MALMTRSALYHRIDSMRRKYGIRGVFDPYAFLEAQKIPLALHRFTDGHLHGVLVRTGRRYGIILDTRLTPAEQRFTLTHEIVHFELHRGEPGAAAFHNSSDEYQADEGAAELLMPYRDFLPRAAAMRRKFLSDQTAALILLAAHYRLDCEQVRRRLKSLAYELSLYRKGVPVSEIKPLSLRCQAERRLAIDGFTKPKRPVSLSGIDVFCDDSRSSAE